MCLILEDIYRKLIETETEAALAIAIHVVGPARTRSTDVAMSAH